MRKTLPFLTLAVFLAGTLVVHGDRDAGDERLSFQTAGPGPGAASGSLLGRSKYSPRAASFGLKILILWGDSRQSAPESGLLDRVLPFQTFTIRFGLGSLR
jgi:hypothetical protein